MEIRDKFSFVDWKVQYQERDFYIWFNPEFPKEPVDRQRSGQFIIITDVTKIKKQIGEDFNPRLMDEELLKHHSVYFKNVEICWNVYKWWDLPSLADIKVAFLDYLLAEIV